MQLWALQNIGQVDQRDRPAWQEPTSTRVRRGTLRSVRPRNVVAVIDTGIDYTHPDLAANVWSAPTAYTVNIDGIAITCAAGTHGFNAITRTCDPMDDHDHGTHVSGPLARPATTALGVVGVNWTTQLMGIKFLDANGQRYDWPTRSRPWSLPSPSSRLRRDRRGEHSCPVEQLGRADFSQALLDEMNAANDEDMLFVAGAGNDSFDNDIAAVLSGELRRAQCRLGRGDRQHRRPGVVLELRRVLGSPGRARRRHPVDDDRQHVRVPERHVDGDAACVGSGGARAVAVRSRYRGVEGDAARLRGSAALARGHHDERRAA